MTVTALAYNIEAAPVIDMATHPSEPCYFPKQQQVNMPKPKPVYTAAEVAAGGFARISSFFFTKPKPGRKGKASKAKGKGKAKASSSRELAIDLSPPTAAQVATAASAKVSAATATAKESARVLASAAASAAAGVPLAAAEAAAVAQAAAAATAVPKGTRTNWSKGDDLERLKEALAAWENQVLPWELGLSLSGFAHKVRIPESTLGSYINGKKIVGKGSGRPSLLVGDEEAFMVDLVRRHDRARDGLGAAEVVGKMSELRPDLTSLQAKNAAYQIRKQNSDVLTNPTKAQASTTARTNINVAQQARFHQVLGRLLDCR